MPLVIAVDGPSGTGKSSVCRAVATELGLGYLDTGAMYRAVTVYMLRAGIDVTDRTAVASALVAVHIEPSVDPSEPGIRLGGHDVSQEIRTSEVTAAVSSVSAVPEVRSTMVELQRALVNAAPDGIVVEGRDIGSVVLPNATLKVFLTADPAARAARRADQDGTSPETVATQLAARDLADSSRAASPFVQSPDAVVVDTTHLDVVEAVRAILDLVQQS